MGSITESSVNATFEFTCIDATLSEALIEVVNVSNNSSITVAYFDGEKDVIAGLNASYGNVGKVPKWDGRWAGKITGLSPGTSYYLQATIVFQFISGGKLSTVAKETKSNNFKTSGIDNISPTVSNKNITIGAVTSTTIPITWQKATDNATAKNKLLYTVHINKTGEFLMHYIGTFEDISSYTFTGLNPNTSYDIGVNVTDEAGRITHYDEIKGFKTPPAASVPATSVGISPTGAINLTVGATATLTATVSPSEATNKTVTWSSSNTAVATVSAGVVSAKSVGNTIITATTNNGKTATRKVTVTTATDNTPPTVSNKTITVTDVNATSVTILWNTATDIVTSKANLKYEMWAEDREGYKSPVTTLTGLTGATASYTYSGLNEAESYAFWVVVVDEAYKQTKYDEVMVLTGKQVTWTSSNTAVATVAASGTNNATCTVTGKTAGTATITAKTWDGSGSFIVRTATRTVTVTAGGATADVTPPELPSDKTPKISNITQTGATVAWVKATDPGGTTQANLRYKVTFRKVEGFDLVHESAMLKDVDTYTHNSFVPSTQYTAVVNVYDEAGNESQYNPIVITTLAAPTTTVPVTGVNLSPATLALEAGQSQALTHTVEPPTATNNAIEWYSNNKAVATVSAAGVVTAVAADSATITVTTVDGFKQAFCVVTVTTAPTTTIPVTGVSLNKSATTINTGKTETLAATVAPPRRQTNPSRG